ncbi:MAG: AlpA family phage regulatory protein [Chromatiaceae bacterium]|nr:AlpA family phage regulatory protein [Chromatiaceae bacterium]MCF8002864.1 AlpA family phage regulatory protein [Chromatiaceae bacterium]
MSSIVFSRLPAVERAIGLKRSALYDRIAKGTFPAPVDLGPQAVAWISSEVEAIQKAIINGAAEDDLKALVSTMHEARGYVPDEAKRAKYQSMALKRRASAQASGKAA